MAVSPRTKAKFAIFEPTTLPIAISGCPFMAASKLTTSSGAEVPKETNTTPITSFETLKCTARETLPFTKKSPLKIKSTKPRKRKM